ncbi:BglG family transcription antiterminator [Pontibacillus yanchengensis]|uniref:PTS fructose transporter subunit IIA n=1 Tax=Pontibacillus yanchengensis Y32 TaxID=1385514 RepID=A0A0A2TEZ2_9BACI|nr:PTS sugar transporter subunit IIA [Pontibacillus yanchengensis]KGP72691.1 PTS fructose transporter subunit IIA [Pontibacillus yanchengensis Y32]
MISGRMIQIMKYLEGKDESSIRELSQELDFSERKIRYDIDNINRHLETKGLKGIRKESKGRLVIPEDLTYKNLQEEEEYFFSQEERTSIISFLIFFNIERLNLNQLTETFKVSRTTLKNDLSMLESDMKKKGIIIEYDRGYKLIGNETNILNERVRLFREYIEYFDSGEEFSDSYYRFLLNEIKKALNQVDLFEINDWTKTFLKQIGWVLNDDSYYWYLANIFVFTWYLKNKVDNPLKGTNLMFGPSFDMKIIEDLEEIIQYKLNEDELEVLVGFVFFTSKYASLNEELDLITTETTVKELISNMSARLEIPFDQDPILYKGLLNHVAPLLQRLRSNVQIYDDVFNVIPDEYEYIREEVRNSVNGIELLNKIKNENELILLAIHFLASTQRTTTSQYKNVLLVCGLGYGAITMIKDKLNSTYQINYVETIPLYMLNEFTDWVNVDLIITTSKLHIDIDKPIVQINAVMTESDFKNLESAGLQKKNILTNYFSINRRLDFLDGETKTKVMDVIKEELGYSHVRIPEKLSLSDLIGIDAIRIINQGMEWKEAIKLGGKILSENGFIDDAYTDNIIKIQDQLGFYSVKDQEFALLHGNDSKLVKVSSVSLLICKESISFGDKQAKVIFLLASKDKKEQIPAVTELTKMTYHTDFITQLERAENPMEANQIIREYEKKIK